MHARTFIGLILLIAALFVASVPELLDPTARGVEKAAIQVGFLKQATPPGSSGPKDATSTQDPVDKRLALRGYVLEEDGDLRDTVDPLDRESQGARRLRAGSSRTLMPDQVADPAADIPPASSEDGVLLDITGCPLFRPDTDVAMLLANPELQALYAGKVSGADDPAACEVVLQERIATATARATTPALGATTARDRAAIRRGGTAAMIIGLGEIELLAQFMDDSQIQDALDALAGTDATEGDAAATAGATAATKTTSATTG